MVDDVHSVAKGNHLGEQETRMLATCCVHRQLPVSRPGWNDGLDAVDR